MGFTGLARWLNAPPTGLQLVCDNLMLNHNGQPRGKWNLSVKSYRSQLGQIPGFQTTAERSMYALTLDDNVFILLEDPTAPSRADVLAAAPLGKEALYLQDPSHYRNTFLTLRPPGALEQLLNQIKARWIAIRQTSAAGTQRNQTSGQQLIIDGQTFAIGTDWLVRIGNVILAGGAVKGMLLEAEYLPLPVLHSAVADGTSELLSNLLTSILPNVRDAKTVAVTISDAQWEDVLWDREEELKNVKQVAPETRTNDPYAWDTEDVTEWKQGDWVGVDRDQRSAFLIMGALRSEGLL
ncbi:hypothetical protein HYPSUDRAFT_61086 [Hypholoma sublateritium FD-334 SS-4]|uniref:Mediator of RNA polymerase II transcription subunit 20 n=1 Tax=Hypholoma sublateritium (strain FD-334 SS-4) TaxID=945553 RepID=A0A0D2PQ47_HYPSF|nr:hypothetical protein HYPSUDRAFT_61086 [Hypholoma sublateritium FD-334 SS-4]